MRMHATAAGLYMTFMSTPAAAMDPNAGQVMIALMIAGMVGVIGGAIAGWQRFAQNKGFAYTYCAALPAMVLPMMITRHVDTIGDLIQMLILDAIIAVIPLGLAYLVAYEIAKFVRSKR